MSVLTGIGPTELLALDAEMYEAVHEAASRRWTEELELAAVSAEIAHAHLLAYLRVHSKKGTRLPDVLQVPRPEAPEVKPAPISVAGLAELAGAGVERVEVSDAG